MIAVTPQAAPQQLDRHPREKGSSMTLTAEVVSSTPAPRRPGSDPEGGDRAGAPTSVSKALQLLDAFRLAGPSLGVSELARRAGVPKSTAFRLLAYLEQGGYVERTGTDYRLGWRLFELGNRVHHCRPRGLRDLALPYLSELYVSTGNVVHLGVLEGNDVVYLEKIHGHRAVRTPTTVGGRMPAACVGLGKAILAFGDAGTARRVVSAGLERRTPYSIAEPGRFLNELGRVRTNGIAFDREEAALGLTCVAAPILVDGRAVAAISVSGSTTRFNPSVNAAHVRRAAAQISAEYAAAQAA
ncbi:IclR family transcriptional regulator [Geodermatophilus sp. CPCC 205506]|uniref:IclR family transcriptional regulator n=1 Tax=Geodermatophilus sp. CPCC 205506 TaxID=2936596 RepID=UPI003EEE0582